MKRLTAGLLAVLVLALSACGGKGEPTPTPASTPTPTATGTPSQAELSAMAEETYRTFFAEWTRLEREGGATEPTPAMRATATDQYLESVMAFLRDQKQTGYRIVGPMATARAIAAPGGDFAGIDPQLTLKVCEDSSHTTYTVDGTEDRGYLVEGVVYFRFVADRPKLVTGTTQRVDQCSF